MDNTHSDLAARNGYLVYALADLARFALSEFERNLEGLTDDEARVRLAKADGTQMNSISWTVAHLAWHWHLIDESATGAPVPANLAPFASGSHDPTPPSLEHARGALTHARELAEHLVALDDETMGTAREGQRETIGTQVMRGVLHTWFHTGEINAMRQMLGHEEIRMIGRMRGQLEWRPALDATSSSVM